MTQAPSVAMALMGHGTLFDDIVACAPALAAGGTLRLMPLSPEGAVADQAMAMLQGQDPSGLRIFTAIDDQALNHARLDIYMRLRLGGFRALSLRHPSAAVADGVRIGENCWIGASAVIAHGVQIGNNTVICDAARIEAGARLGANAWVGPGASIGRGTTLGSHSVVAGDVHIAAGLQVGRHCAIGIAGAYTQSLPDGSFVDPLFPSTVRIYGTV
ncbi:MULTISPECIES: DapH/DapD/GlmU-related protein [Delftia]|uniref:DapH/DapD/GlmU-related protein n=1 Tax=Delftia TaxID=80865 RepID=UPI002897A1FA|nr:DapH/DapD/GlmU-related protein [Delftia tsuruhatensis]